MAAPPPQPPNFGCGRGGRGAMLMAALEQPARRPDHAVESSDDGSRPASIGGRGALLRSMISTSSQSSISGLSSTTLQSPTGSTLPSTVSSPVPSPALSVGRAAILASLPGGRGALLGRGAIGGRALPVNINVIPGGMQTPQGPLTIPRADVPSSPPVKKFEQMKINDLRGKEGRPVNLEVNYLRLKVEPGKGVFEYHVNFNPQVDSRQMRFVLLRDENVKPVIGTTKTFDGSKLYLPMKLQDPITTLNAVMPTDGTVIELHIKFIGECGGVGKRDATHLFNLLLRKVMHKLNMTLIGRNYFDSKGGIPIPQHRLQVWPGYVTSVAEYQDGLMLNCDASFKVLRDLTALDILKDMYNSCPEKFQEMFMKQVVGQVVITRYNNKTYRIDDVAFDQNPLSTFTNSKGEEVQFLQYYKNAYDITIKDELQPLLLNNPKLRANDKNADAPQTKEFISLVPELCNMTGLTDAMRADFKIMKDIACHTRVSPEVRQLTFRKYVDNVKKTVEAKNVLEEWGLFLDDNPISLMGRALDCEKIMFGRGKQCQGNAEADWGRDAAREHMLVPVPLRKWVLIFTQRDAGKAREFVDMMNRTCPQMGMEVAAPMMKQLLNDRTDSFTRTAKESVDPSVQLVVFIFPTSRDDRYSAVKKLCCVEMPVPSQVIIARTIGQPAKLRSVVQKIGLQINCKLGGELWAVQIPLKKTMVIGVDVYHDPTRGGASVVGFVASLNNTFTRWFSLCPSQRSGQELIDCLKSALTSAIMKFDEVNHFYPEKIIFFRDGVSDGQLSHVCDYEVPQLESCFTSFGENYKPTLTVVIVQKRINTRLFLKMNNTLKNPQPGTILDHTVTRREWFDFFLVSQHVRQGTVTPTHYVVVHNTSNLQPDHIQKLSYKLTHLYYNWPGTVRVPAPCQYAHKLAYLVGQNIHKTPDMALSDKLYFL